MSVQEFILQFSTVPLVGACVVGLLRYRHLETTRRYLVWLSWLALLVTGVAAWFSSHHRPNLFLAPIDTAIELTLLGLMYRRALRPLAMARYLPLGIGLFLLGTVLSYSPRLDTVEFSPIQHFIESVVVLILALLYLRQLLQPPITMAPLEREPMFWVSAGAILYFAGNSLIFLTSNLTLFHSRELSLTVWTVHALLYSFLNGFYIVALSVTPRPAPLARVTQS
ncbi:hypothetical protein MON38_11070 [Hymenobacter sp. DH14]|uniref:Uncharacterized protein n=1 Tax=Hymenobacter cyanobacteriorum TaxID=2926463 RepID=A0A9X1VFS9_9BACT|nr:hypothetical protein [Hymenobacter cyanobacteriorum]MCI1187962.1 hypothetical protein [Hymenobacter cyanobacteriorum]